MREKGLLGLLVTACYVLSITTICVAEMHSQKNGLFKVDIPDGWSWAELSGKVRIGNPKGNAGISIQFKPVLVESDEKRKERLKTGNQMMIKSMVEPNKGTVLSERERRINGVYARQLDFLTTLEGKTGQMTYISFFNKDYAFTITFASPNDEEILKMEEIVETFQFQ